VIAFYCVRVQAERGADWFSR